jgi:glycosyltransferase involved in cell wall biosynthesis
MAITTEPKIPLRLGVQQRVLPSYRVAFFDALAGACRGGMGLFSGEPRPVEAIETGARPQAAVHFPARNRHFMQGPFYVCWQQGLLEWLDVWQPDALVVEANPRYLSTPQAVRWMHARRRPVIGWGLGVPRSAGRLAGLRETTRGGFLRQFNAMIAYSRQGAEEYRQVGLPAERIFVAPNAVVPRPVEPAPERPDVFAGDRPTLLFVGRLQSRKRIDLLLQACARLESHPRLWVVGDGPAREYYEHLAADEYPDTQFFGAHHGAELEPYFLAADLFVLPGTGGLAVQQAMTYALPVVVAEGDGTQSDLVRPGNGWQVKPGSLDELTAGLSNALSDIGRLRRMGRESFRIVREEINLEKMVEVFAAAIKSVI